MHHSGYINGGNAANTQRLADWVAQASNYLYRAHKGPHTEQKNFSWCTCCMSIGWMIGDVVFSPAWKAITFSVESEMN